MAAWLRDVAPFGVPTWARAFINLLPNSTTGTPAVTGRIATVRRLSVEELLLFDVLDATPSLASEFDGSSIWFLFREAMILEILMVMLGCSWARLLKSVRGNLTTSVSRMAWREPDRTDSVSASSSPTLSPW